METASMANQEIALARLDHRTGSPRRQESPEVHEVAAFDLETVTTPSIREESAAPNVNVSDLAPVDRGYRAWCYVSSTASLHNVKRMTPRKL